MNARVPYPLQWPDGIARLKPEARTRSLFHDQGQRAGHVSIYQSARDVVDELTGSRIELDPGVAVWFDYEGNEMVFACDRWLTHGENLRAIANSIYAMRGLERWGMADVVNRAFAGFKALPPGSSGTMDAAPPPPPPWRVVLGGTWPQLDKFELLVLAKTRYRRLIVDAHPDAGGTNELAAMLNRAMAEAELELGSD